MQMSGSEPPVEWNSEADHPAFEAFSQWTPESLEGASRSPRTRHSRKSPDGHIPRPPNAFILFRSSFIRSQRVSSEVETSHSTLSKIIGLTWQNLSMDERRVWHDRAREAMIEHRRRFPAYAFRPANRRGRGSISSDSVADNNTPPTSKRRVREHAVDDPVRCEKIAALLAEGKQGHELEEAMQEFDRQRGPSVVPARFEPPITARTYRRSSSAPAPDTEMPAAFLRKAEPVLGQRRRSSSSGPPARRSSKEKDATPQPETRALDDCFSPWMAAPEPVYFDFSEFSFIPENPPLPQFTCDPLWTHDQLSNAYTEYNVSPEFTGSGLDVGAFQWAQPGGGFEFDVNVNVYPELTPMHSMGSYDNPQSEYGLEM
ncbi:hypothetical protein FB45DRAFT_1030211 [Roridomyces roridus]|uniref:HMG box domain-containing protein n=1 Tax=Roridomyces roridus TaxID=1738132 RepID=A0AAD7BNV3_9AGAR|nr:hypothetical protein FB45DRAFT_1030211 [Roridomyces roridus]